MERGGGSSSGGSVANDHKRKKNERGLDGIQEEEQPEPEGGLDGFQDNLINISDSSGSSSTSSSSSGGSVENGHKRKMNKRGLDGIQEEEQPNPEGGLDGFQDNLINISDSSRANQSGSSSTSSSLSGSVENGLDGIPEGNLINISDSSGFHFYHTCISSLPVVAYFTGAWCGPASGLNDLVIELSDYYVTLTFLKIDLPEDNEQSGIHEFMTGINIRELPTFLFYYRGTLVFKLVGAFSDELIHLTHSLYVRQAL